MSGKIYNKNLTFLQDQPFAENLLTGFHYKKRKAKLFSKTDPSRAKQLLNSNIKSTIRTDSSSSFTDPALQGKKQSTRLSFGSTRTRNKSEKMKKAEATLVKHFCLTLERSLYNEEHESLYTRAPQQRLERPNELQAGNIIPHLLVSVDSMQNTLLATRSSRPTERIKPPSHFKKILRESRKIRLLYGNLSRRQLFWGTSKMCFPGENLLLWLESRLDVVLERCGFFGSVKAARQSVLSGHIIVNSKVVKSPGFILEGGDIIKVAQVAAKRDFANTATQQSCVSLCLPLNPLVDQFSRGAILSNEVFPYLLREKSLATALSNGLQKYKSTAFLKSSLPSRPPAREFFPYKSFYTWLLRKKQRNFQPSKGLYRQSNALPTRELQLKRVSAQSTVNLDREILSSENWRFIGSPHLLSSFFFLHGHLQKVISLLADACSKSISVDKRFGKLFSYKAQRWNNISAQRPQTTTNTAKLCCHPSLFVLYKTHFNLPTISLTSKRCGVNIVTSNSLSSPGSATKGGGGPSLDTLNIESFLNLGRHSLQKIKNNRGLVNPKTGRMSYSQSDTPTTIHNLFGYRFARVLTELYNNLFPWFNYSDQAEYLATQKEFKFDRGAFLQLVSGLVRKDEKSLLGALLLDLLLYSLLIKKELVCTHLEKKQLERVVSSASAAGVTFTKKHKISDIDNKINSKVNCFAKQNTNRGLDQRLKSNLKENPKASSNLELVLDGSRTPVDNSRPSKMLYKKFNSNQRLGLNIGKHTKPLHLEVSYQSLCAVYLFPPQRVCLPIMIDLDCLAKSL
uniref:30S ribosomal protein S4 n=1 Tax=Chloroidium sp. UTEX 3077 TaxID=2686440 RepID=A0A6B9ERP2_9CHLO|nr:30S ribosomal protein S4 [Chloroidium sp. UTEX 3077]